MIGIITPYGRCDTTAAALRLADLGIAQGADVKLVALGRKETSVHPFWDNRVCSGKADGIYHGTRGCDTVVHFVTDANVLSMVKLVSEGAKNILVPPWHSLIAGAAATCKEYDRVVLHGKTYADFFRSQVRDDHISWCRWESGLPHVRRDGLVKASRVCALIYCDGATIDFCGPMVLELCNELLRAVPKLEIGLLSMKSWSRRDRATIKNLEGQYAGRFAKVKSRNIQEYATLVHHYDWVVCPGVRSDFGMHISTTLSCGAAVIANDIPPFDELITPKHNGLLVACEVKTNGMRAPLAVPAFGKWLEACNRAFSTNQLLFSMQQRDWQLAHSQRTFNEFWLKTWSA